MFADGTGAGASPRDPVSSGLAANPCCAAGLLIKDRRSAPLDRASQAGPPWDQTFHPISDQSCSSGQFGPVPINAEDVMSWIWVAAVVGSLTGVTAMAYHRRYCGVPGPPPVRPWR